VPLSGLASVRIKDVGHITKHIQGMLAEKPSLTPTFKIGEQEFGFVPELDNITYGEFVDLDTYLQDVENLHKAMAVLYRPIVQKVKSRYLIEPYESASKYSDTMKQAPMHVALGALLFFWRLGNELLQATLTSLEKAESKTSTPDKDSSPSVGDGTQPSISLLKAMLEDLQTFPNLSYTSVFSS
jgi:hypothetical protein